MYTIPHQVQKMSILSFTKNKVIHITPIRTSTSTLLHVSGFISHLMHSSLDVVNNLKVEHITLFKFRDEQKLFLEVARKPLP